MSFDIIARRYAPSTIGDFPLQTRKVGLHQRVTKFGVLTILLFGPLAFGAVEPWAILTLELAAALLMVVWTLGEIFTSAPSITRHPLYIPSGLFLLLIAAQFLLHRTVDRQQTFESLLLYLAFGAITFLAIQSFRDETDYRHLIVTLAVFGFLLGMLGFVQDFTAGGRLYWLRIPTQGGAIYGPYVNKNHFAGIMELLIPFALAGAINRKLPRDQRFVLAFCVLLMGVTVILCGSRGGMVGLASEIVFFVVLLVMRERRLGQAVGVALLLQIILAGALVVSGDSVLGKVATFNNRDEAASRYQIAKDSIKMFKERPVLGWGMGAFPAAYPKFRTIPSAFSLNAAHNDYLQALTETGLIGFGLVILFIAIVYRGGIQNYRRRRLGSWSNTLSLACMTAFTGILVHSFFDFNLQIPANALLFYVCGAMACGNSARPTTDALEFDRVQARTLVNLR